MALRARPHRHSRNPRYYGGRPPHTNEKPFCLADHEHDSTSRKLSLPNSGRAVVDAAKVRDYLLSETHPVGRFKAAFFANLGYSADHWELLCDDLLALGRAGPAAPGKPSAFGRTFEVDGILIGPSGRSAGVKTVWIVRANEDLPRFVTAFPR